MVPPEVEVCVGAGAPEAGEHARVGVDGATRVGAVQRARDRAVEHVLVPGRQQHRATQPHLGARRQGLAGCDVDRERLVVGAPQHDARVMSEHVDHRARLTHCGLADAARVAPLEREVLPEKETGVVGRLVQLGT